MTPLEVFIYLFIAVAMFVLMWVVGHITCYSEGQVIYDVISTGKISNEKESSGWFLKDSKTGKLIRVSGDCVVENQKENETLPTLERFAVGGVDY